jgi:hypothetical protein
MHKIQSSLRRQELGAAVPLSGPQELQVWETSKQLAKYWLLPESQRLRHGLSGCHISRHLTRECHQTMMGVEGINYNLTVHYITYNLSYITFPMKTVLLNGMGCVSYKENCTHLSSRKARFCWYRVAGSHLLILWNLYVIRMMLKYTNRISHKGWCHTS